MPSSFSCTPPSPGTPTPTMGASLIYHLFKYVQSQTTKRAGRGSI